VGLVYDPRELPGVTTVRPRVAGVLQMVSDLTLVVSRVRTGTTEWYQSHVNCRNTSLVRIVFSLIVF
jgi:hypothetical protein